MLVLYEFDEELASRAAPGQATAKVPLLLLPSRGRASHVGILDA